MSEIKLNPKLDLDLPFEPYTPAQNTITPVELNNNFANTSPVSTISQNIETVPIAAAPIYAAPLPQSDTVQAPVASSNVNAATKQKDMVMIVSFLLFLISLGAAGYFLYQYFK